MILKQLLLGSLVLVGMSITSCGDSDKEGTSTENTDTVTTPVAPAAPTTTTVVQGNDTTSIQMAPAQQQAQPASGGSGKVNPPHGQPGHDCKVAVGAPLP